LISSLYIVYGVVILHCFLCVVGGVVLSTYILYCFLWAVIYIIVTLIYIIHLGEEFFFQWPF
jgi:heme/copper-type cytochrome/quinol oxidase subunit 4